MSNQRNNSGVQLSASNWLEDHHNAKKELRYHFAKKIAEFQPKSIVDIGCGTGLWLSVFNDILPKDCKFIGVDLDPSSLNEARKRSSNWERECEWKAIDINKEPEAIPVADLALIFNFSSYIEDLELFFSSISQERGFKGIALRQFAGDEIKFGPFNPNEHEAIASSLKNSIGSSNQIRYYDMDRLIEVALKTGRTPLIRDFELYKSFSPFTVNSWPYIKGTAEWTADRMPKYEKNLIHNWLTRAAENDSSLYFFSLDWIALLS